MTNSASETDRHAAAMRTVRTAPHLHVPRLIQNAEINARLHGAGVMGRINAAMAVHITRIVGTMYCAYAFTLIALVALPAAIEQGSPTVLINWLSSNFLQLVLLPIIIVGQNVISAAQDARGGGSRDSHGVARDGEAAARDPAGAEPDPRPAQGEGRFRWVAPSPDELGREDSNLRLPDPESGALPLGHSPLSG